MNRVKRGIQQVSIVLFIVMLMLVTLALPVSAGATVDRSSWTEELTGFWAFNQCTGEWILCWGAVSYSVQSVTDVSGGYHWVYRGHHNLSGVGTYGNEYQIISNFVQHINTGNGGLPNEWTFINTSPLISHGKDTNMTFYVRNRVSVNANGEVTVSFSETWVDCQGH